MPTIRANTVGSPAFDPDIFFEEWSKFDFRTSPAASDNDLKTTIIAAFRLPAKDTYVYHAVASVTLSQVQQAINAGTANGLHAWYRDAEDNPVSMAQTMRLTSVHTLADGGEQKLPSPTPGDINAYTSIFSSTTSTTKALTGFISNAKKGSLRASISMYLSSKRQLPSHITIPKLKTPHVNPYLDLWAWSCQNLEWAGPDEEHTLRVRHSHPVLPILMHHFGCLSPSFECLEVIKQIARDRSVLEMGSGNGYWAYMLRRLGVTVTAVDNRQSVYRTLWISDTLITDGIAYLKKEKGAKDRVLLLVYPIVGGEGFTSKVLHAYLGDTILVAGTQNKNGYTGFKDVTIAEYMAKEKTNYEKTVQIPLPSFAGKDEALFVFEKREKQETGARE